MDHFNSTVKDGKLVNTRRGLQVSRQKFNGISFVNTSAQDPSPSASDSSVKTDSSRAPLRQIKFVERGSDTVRSGGTEISFISDSGQGKKPRRRAANNPRGEQQQQQQQQQQRLTNSPTPGYASCSSRSSSLTPSCTGEQQQGLGSQPGFSAIDPRIIASPTPSSSSSWATQDAITTLSLSDDEWRLFQHYYPQIPHQAYPYEDILAYNPIRVDDFYNLVTSDIAALHCVLMCGTIAQAVVNSETDPKGFAYHISKICAILNRKLDQKNRAADAITLHCIASLARMGCYVGRLDHWHMHMRGLQKVLDVNGGLGGLPPWLLEEIHTADLKGAAALASTPYLPFQRRHFQTILPVDVHEYASSTLNSLLRPLGVMQEVIDVMASLAALGSAVRLARHSGRTVTFDPQLFTEEWQTIMYSLITRPGPLRETSASTDPTGVNPYFSGIPSTDATAMPSSNSTATENYMANHRLRPSIPVVAARTGNHLESALRIVGLLYLKELLPDWPRNLGGYAVLLSLLRQHLGAVVGQFGDIGPVLQPNQAQLRPVATFLAMMGNLASRLADDNEGTTSMDDRYERRVFRDCLRDVAGLRDEEDLVLIRLFDLRSLVERHGEDGGNGGRGWRGDAVEVLGLVEEVF
ncbi:hypothetical protein QBC38DRAFT_224347 [Podospora fimiseda]|uniref:Uncharacterized protein n=1 Tax=Podospora fimiseda TaxID=252190 RepID=A0AAN7H7S9_9PEZI|nr:hypothetical protein QBC38DRAFT_224347 [Podospora fimiseda]